MRSIVAIAGLAACAHTPDANLPAPNASPANAGQPADASSADPTDELWQRAAGIDAQVSEDLEQLEALEVFTVGELIGGDASQAFNCYDPCDGAESVVDDYEQRALALNELTEVAMADHSESDAECDMDAVDAHLDALRALQVVEVGEFVSQQAAPSPYCYNLPCPADEAAAQEVNCARANTLEALVDAVSE